MRKILILLIIILCFNKIQNKQNEIIYNSNVSDETIILLIKNDKKLNVKNPFQKFCDENLEHAIKYHISHGIPVSIQLGQAIAESGGGKSDIGKKANNLFGMVYYKELYKGDYYETPSGSKWRKYNSFKDSFHDHAEFLYTFYRHAIGKEWKYWVNNCGGYGGTNYWDHIGKYIINNELDKYDEVVNEYIKLYKTKV
jgi:flagellum-specific peptidoglycan hydrolase FlgJ